MHSLFHYSSFKGGNASEYIIPKGKITITSHGMGSGIYGLSREYLSVHPPTNTELSKEYRFDIKNPFVLYTNEDCEKYMEMSMSLMRMIEENVNDISCIGIYSIVSRYFYKLPIKRTWL